MNVAWGVVMIVTSSLAWGGQVLSWAAPGLAARWGLAEAEDDVDPTFWLDARGEAAWDSLVLWTMPLAGTLLVADHAWWAHLGLIGGGSYLYFAGRGIVVRSTMRRQGVQIGSASSVRAAVVALSIWGVVAVITIVAALAALENP